MNDEEKKNTPAAENGNGGNKQGRNRRRRHRGGKRPEQRAGEQAERAAQQPVPEVPAQPKEKAGAGERTAADGEQNGQNGNRRGRNRRDRRRRGNDRGKNEGRGIEDLDGTPTEADALSLDELRARIVVQAADGSVPAQAPVKEPAREPEPAEPVELPVSEEDLLGAMPEVFSSHVIPEEDRVEIIGVRFRNSQKPYYFDPKGKTVRAGDPVLVDTARGYEFGYVAFGNRVVNKNTVPTPLRPLIRPATAEDVAHDAENRRRETEAADVFRRKMTEHKLDMKLIDVQFAFDNSKLLFYFTSEGRVDFRELVKDLAGVFRTRIELRQIGIRDEARLLGGLGACGRPLCCSTFLSDFAQVSIKMAKEQGLSLNSTKISGACGRLMCCLHYETASYAEEIRRTPPVGSTVRTPDGVGEVIGNNPIAATVRVALKDADAPRQYSRDDVTVLPREAKAPEESAEQ